MPSAYDFLMKAVLITSPRCCVAGYVFLGESVIPFEEDWNAMLQVQHPVLAHGGMHARKPPFSAPITAAADFRTDRAIQILKKYAAKALRCQSTRASFSILVRCYGAAPTPSFADRWQARGRAQTGKARLSDCAG